MMERALKERIIGAIVLVAVVVLVVPVFLDGPPAGDEVRTEHVPLPGQDEASTQTVVLNRDRTNPVPVRTVDASSNDKHPPTENAENEQASAPKPAAATSPPRADETVAVPVVKTAVAASAEPAKANTEEPPPAPLKTRSTTGMYAVQLGSFSNKQNAENLAADLRKQGFAAFLSQLNTDSGQLQRVRIGPQKDREAAEAMASRLAKAGHKGQVVPHP